MIIDFHTHVYPDLIAKRTVSALSSTGHIMAHTDGTLDALKAEMKKSSVDISVVLPVATKPAQFDTINSFAKKITDKDSGIISFGGIHPDDENIEQHLDYIKSLGLLGIKIHPEYQQTYIDDSRYVRIISHCAKIGLIVVTHSGADPAFTQTHCTPKRGANMLKMVYENTGFTSPFVVFAHLGGLDMYSEVEKHLVGQNCYFDISHCFESCDNATLMRIIENHTADKLLFATDSPWRSQSEYIKNLNDLGGITDSQREKIFYQNAAKLLNLSVDGQRLE